MTTEGARKPARQTAARQAVPLRKRLVVPQTRAALQVHQQRPGVRQMATAPKTRLVLPEAQSPQAAAALRVPPHRGAHPTAAELAEMLEEGRSRVVEDMTFFLYHPPLFYIFTVLFPSFAPFSSYKLAQD